MKRFPMSLLLALNLSIAATVALTAPCVAADMTSDVAPPAVRVERFVPRDGFVWAAGYWDWNGRSYHWVSGTYLTERRGAHWVADQWEQVGSRWQRVSGHWERPLSGSVTASK
jgi:hypothetical protein